MTALPLPATAVPRDTASPQDAVETPHGELVTVTRVFNTLEAEALRGCLEAQGIPATLGDVQTIQTDTLLTHALGGIRVMVPEAFARDARVTLAAVERGEFAIDELPPEDAATAPEADGGSQLGMPRLTTLVAVILLLLGLLVALAPGRLIH